jgi:anthranilate synthase component 1
MTIFFSSAASDAEAIATLQAGSPVLFWTKRVADCDSPVAMMLKLKAAERCSFLLESVMGGEQRGRYSILAFAPDLIWRCKREKAEIAYQGFEDADFIPCAEPSLVSLKQLIRQSQMDLPTELPSMAAGLLGFMGYDMVKQMEALPDANPDPIGIPDACFMRPRVTLIHDAVAGEITITVTIWRVEEGKTAAEMLLQARKQGEDVLARLQAALPAQTLQPLSSKPLEFSSNFTATTYHQAVEKAKEYIRAGEIFQVVPSQRFSTSFASTPFALYRALRHLNPSPFLFCLDFGGFTLVGSSPEILVRLRDGKVTIRPIAGTRPRGKTPAEDNQLAAELLADPKEISEHLMLLDLGRNDVGRVAKGGTVQVTEQMIIERYSHVMHIVSNVEGELAEGLDAVDALVAGFPAGTVSGAPKIRAMEIIDELEPHRRSFYAGCVGYFSANGTMDTCITLRTGLVKDGMLYVQAGGGVVVDSDPQAEYEESCNKAKAVMKAAEIAHCFES